MPPSTKILTLKPGIDAIGPPDDGPDGVGLTGCGFTGCEGDGPDGDGPLLSISGPFGCPLLLVFILNTVLINSSKLCWQWAVASTLNTTIITFCMFAN